MRLWWARHERGPGRPARSSKAADTLERLAAGACGRILAVDGEDGERERLEEMGLCQGRLVEVVQSGNPMVVRVLGTRVGLAAALAARIRVAAEAESLAADGLREGKS